ncbi:MAG: J domain-containing protein [Sphingobium sp.]|nr:J domain-containing protein [Sphingobium sp.]MCI2053630.1 J domain-containing protein [Sphingobium sp.]
MPAETDPPRRSPRFHGRVEGAAQHCAIEGCPCPGEFRAPATRDAPADRPPQWRWLCLDHVREFNAGYNFFSGMSADEIAEAQRPYAGWERETRAFSSNAHAPGPKWADFADPLDAIGAGYRQKMDAMRAEMALRKDGKALSPEDRKAMKTLDLAVDADRKALRERYTALVRRYHPDHNGGDRSHEKALQDVIAAYTHLRKAPAFA